MPKDLRELVHKNRRQHADLRPARYLWPLGHGLHLVELDEQQVVVGALIGEATLRGGAMVVVGTFAGGRSRMILGLAPTGYRGGSSFPKLAASTRRLGSIQIMAAVPAVLEAGAADQGIYLVGYGFSDDPLDTFAAFVGSFESDPYVTIHDPQWIEDPAAVGVEATGTQGVVRVLVDVSEAAPDGYFVNVRATRGRLSSNRYNLLEVLPAEAGAGPLRYYAFWDTGSLIAGTYSGLGTHIEDLGSVSGSGFRADRASIIYSDAAGRVSPGSLIWASTSGDLIVADFAAGATNTYSPASGEVAGGAYISGWVYWVEHERVTAPTSTITLKRSRADLDPDDTVTIGTYQAPHFFGPPINVEWLESWAVAFSPTHVLLTIKYDAIGQGSGSASRLSLVDASGESAQDVLLLPLAAPSNGNAAVTGHYRWDGGEIGEGGSGSVWQEWLPATWPINEGIGAVDGSGSTVALYDGTAVYEGKPTAPAVDPDFSTLITPHPDRGMPDLIYLAVEIP